MMDNDMAKIDLKIAGMSCASCALKIEYALKSLAGVEQVSVSYDSSIAGITYDHMKIEVDQFKQVIEQAGYSIVDAKGQLEQAGGHGQKGSRSKIRLPTAIGVAVIVLAVYVIINNTIGFDFVPAVNQSMGYGILFVIGLLTSIHCLAMCGGINLSQCIVKTDGSQQKSVNKLRPGILYNIGRVISYTVIGGIAGAIGSVVGFSGTAKGIVAIVAGVFMILMGLNMLNLFPWLKKIVPRIPRKIGSRIYGARKGNGPLIVGFLNGLMPCGPLQTMQLYALGTGSLFAGAFSMLSFSLGTVPLMFGLGAVSSMLSSRFTRKLMTVSAMFVVVLGIVMLGRGFNQSGISIALSAVDTSNIAKIEENVQLVTTNMEPNLYEPFVVQEGIPVKWTIVVEEGDLNGCNNPVVLPRYGIEKKLEIGENVIEFTPTETGNIVYTCWMGMISGNITVESNTADASAEDVSQANYKVENSDVGRSCCTIDSSAQAFDDGQVRVDNVAVSVLDSDSQTVGITVNEYGFMPALIIMQRDVPAKWTIVGETLNSCNNNLIFPSYNAQLNLQKGENMIEFTPTKDFSFSCWMGMINGYVKVVDDVDDIDLDQIRTEVSSYSSFNGESCCG